MTELNVSNKILLLILALMIFCSIIIALFSILVLTPLLLNFGQPPVKVFNNSVNDDIEEIKAEIKELDSIDIFKERFPDYREEFTVEYDVHYTIQSRNTNTGNVLALYVYYPLSLHDDFEAVSIDQNVSIDQSLSCMPGKAIAGSKDVIEQLWFPNDNNLFVDDAIKDTKCLDDDWTSIIMTERK